MKITSKRPSSKVTGSILLRNTRADSFPNLSPKLTPSASNSSAKKLQLPSKLEQCLCQQSSTQVTSRPCIRLSSLDKGKGHFDLSLQENIHCAGFPPDSALLHRPPLASSQPAPADSKHMARAHDPIVPVSLSVKDTPCEIRPQRRACVGE